MPIQKETPTRLIKFGSTYAVIPSETIAIVGDAVALGILVYLLDKPDDWIPRKKDICTALNIGSDRWKKATTLLAERDLFMVTEVRDDGGRFLDRIVTISAVPMGLSPKCGKPALGKTESGKSPPIHITEPTHNRKPSKGRQIGDDFEVTSDMLRWVQENDLSHINILAETDKFIDYNKGKGNVGKDWKATWRNWIRNADKFGKERAGKANGRAAIAAAIRGH